MKKSNVPSAAELFSVMPPPESVNALLSVRLPQSGRGERQENSFAMYDISRAHFHGVLWRRVCVCVAPRRGEGKPRTGKWTRSRTRRLTAEEEYVWHGGCECSLAGALRADDEGAQFPPRLRQPCIVLCIWERDIGFLVHSDDLMVEMPGREEKWFEEVLFSKYDGKVNGEVSFGLTETSLTETSSNQMESRMWFSAEYGG